MNNEKPFKVVVIFLVAFILFGVTSVESFVQELSYKGRTLREWQVDLRDLDPGMRITAIDAVGKFGIDGVPVIMDMLSDKDARVRSSAARALGNIGSEAKRALPALVNAFGDQDESVYRTAEDALNKIGPATKEAVPELIKLLGHENSRVRSGAINVLANIEPEKTAAVPALVKALSNKDKRIRASSAKALRALGAAASSAVPTLIKAVADENESVRESAGQALYEIVRETRDTLPALIKAVEHDNEWVRLWAAWILVSLKPAIEDTVAEDAILVLVKAFQHESVFYEYRDDVAETIAESDIAPAAKKAAVPALTKALEDEDKGVRLEVAQALGSIGTEAKDAIPALIKAWGDEDQDLQKRVSEALQKIGPAAKEAVPALTKLLADEKNEVRKNAIVTLANIHPEKKAAVPYLVEALRDEDKRVRSGSAEALELIGPAAKDAVPALIKALGDEYEAVWEPAWQALLKIAQEEKDAVPELVKGLADENKYVRYFVAMILSYMKPPIEETIPVLIRALTDESAPSWVFWDVARALGKFGPAAKDAVPALIKTLRASDVRKRLVAARTLGKIGPAAKDAVPSLMKALGDEDSNVRSAAARGLGKIGPEAKDTVPALMKAVGDLNEVVRRDAVAALGSIGPPADGAVPLLMKLLQNDESAQERAAMAIVRIRREINEVVPPIVNALGNDAVTVFIRLFFDEDVTIRRIAEEALSIMGPSGINSLNALAFIDKSEIQDVITIRNNDQFIDAIGPNRIVLLPADYSINLSNLARKETQYVRWGDWKELIIYNVQNFAIVGMGRKLPEILTELGYGAVISFQNVRNVSISNIQAGHTPPVEDVCYAPVFIFENSSKINMNNCDLFGSGMSGLYLSNVDSLSFNSSIIRDCTSRIMGAYNSSHLEFKKSRFVNNRGSSLIDIVRSSHVAFVECDILDNFTRYSDRYRSALFWVSSSSNISLKNSRIANNETGYFFDGLSASRHVENKVESQLNLEEVSFENNTFRKGKYRK